MKVLTHEFTVDRNPYMDQLYRGMQRRGIVVEELKANSVLKSSPNILHLHWPESIVARRQGPSASIAYLGTRLLIGRGKLAGTKIVYTAHNIRAHEITHAKLQQKLFNTVLSSMNAWISLTSAAEAEIIQAYPRLKDIPHRVIAHGHYRDCYPYDVDPAEARSKLGLALDDEVVLFFGNVRAYKGLDSLVSLIDELNRPKLKLVIAGKTDAESAERLRQGKNVILFPDFIPKDEVQLFLKSADLVALPFTNILNSGSALLALSFGVPILAPRKGSLEDLGRHFGSKLVKLYDGELTSEALSSALNEALADGHQIPDLGPFEWEPIVSQTLGLYNDILSGSASR